MVVELNKIYKGNCLEVLKTFENNSIDCCVTSPPYFGLRDYGNTEQIGLEETPELYVAKMVEVFTEVKRVLKKEGVMWLNLGDSYSGSGRGENPNGKQGTNKGTIFTANTAGKTYGLKPKDLIGIPWMVAFALRSSGWYLRQDIIWHKPNPMPESVTDRCTKAHEYIFLLSKSSKYYYDADAISEPCLSIEYDEQNVLRTKGGRGGFGSLNGKNNCVEYSHSNNTGKAWETSETRNKRSVWTVTTRPYSEAHFATFPERLITDCIKAGCPENGIVLDCFMGAGTTALVARKLNRNFVGIELNPDYIEIANSRLYKELGMFK